MDIKKSKFYETLRSAWMKSAQKKDQKLGVDFSTWESNEQIGIDASKGNQYQPSTDGLKSVLNRLPIQPSDSIVDIGCGKGKAMHIMSQFPFAQIDGIELSDHLCKIASANFKKLGIEQCNVIKANASVFDDYDKYNYFYVFNSFPEQVFEKMLGHIIASISRKPRKVFFIYLNPVCHDLLEKSKVFQLIFTKKSVIKWFQYNCYSNEV